jgi:6-phosphogluconate dehydrogenase
MQIAVTGLGRMGSNIARRLMRAGHECVVHDIDPQPVAQLTSEGAKGATSLPDLVASLRAPRAVWMMLPAGAVGNAMADFARLLEADDVLIDGGNSYYRDDIARAAALRPRGIHYLDVGTSGGVWGLERGYCQMIGGDRSIVERLDPVFAALAPDRRSAEPTPGRQEAGAAGGTAEHGYLYCGPSGAGHFVKMVHNGIEYGIMAAFSEGFNILRHANVGASTAAADAETAPLADPEAFRYDLNVADIAEVWRRGSVISSWLLDLIADALVRDPQLDGFEGRVSDSGEGRWTLRAAIDEGVPAPVLSAALFERFASRGKADFANRLLSAMRHQFGGHVERAAKE